MGNGLPNLPWNFYVKVREDMFFTFAGETNNGF